MHPAKSVIVFTVLSGAGFGLIFVIALGYPFSALDAFPVCALALALSAAGLVSSTFHLGHPERALLALTQWRSSWLSREGVAALIALSLFFAYACLWFFFGVRSISLGILCALSAGATIFATSMIYAQLRTVPRWRTAWTPVCYLLFSLASGLAIAAAISPARQAFGAPPAILVFVSFVCAWLGKLAWWRRAGTVDLKAAGHTREGATGLGSLGSVRLLESPHSGPNYLTKEMVFRIGRKHARTLKRIVLVCGAGAPLAVCAAAFVASARPFWLAFAAAPFIFTLFIERWLFFAEAEHSVSLYY